MYYKKKLSLSEKDLRQESGFNKENLWKEILTQMYPFFRIMKEVYKHWKKKCKQKFMLPAKENKSAFYKADRK